MQFRLNFRMLGKQVPGVGQCERRGVVTSKEDDHDFVAHFVVRQAHAGFAVARGDQSIQQVARRVALRPTRAHG